MQHSQEMYKVYVRKIVYTLYTYERGRRTQQKQEIP